MTKQLLLFLSLALAFSVLVCAAPMQWGIAINEKTKECAGYWGGDEFVDYKLPYSEGWVSYFPGAYDEAQTPYGACRIPRTGFNELSEELKFLTSCCMRFGLTPTNVETPKVVLVNKTQEYDICYLRYGHQVLDEDVDPAFDAKKSCDYVKVENVTKLEYCEYRAEALVIDEALKTCSISFIANTKRFEDYFADKGELNWSNLIDSGGKYLKPGECPAIMPNGTQYAFKENRSTVQATCVPGKGNCTGKFQCVVNGIDALSWCPESEGQCKNYCEFEIIATKIGECYFQRYNEELCCKQLGYKFVSRNIGQKTVTNLGIQNEFFIFIYFEAIPIVVITLILLLVTQKLKITFLSNPKLVGLLAGLLSGLFSVFIGFSVFSLFFALGLGFLVGTILGKIIKR